MFRWEQITKNVQLRSYYIVISRILSVSQDEMKAHHYLTALLSGLLYEEEMKLSAVSENVSYQDCLVGGSRLGLGLTWKE